MNSDKIFLSDEESQNAQENAQHLADIMDIFYSIVRVAALTPKALKETAQNERLAIGIFGMFLKTILADLRSVHVLISICFVDNLTLQVPSQLQLRPGDVSREAWEHLRNFWSTK